MGSFRLAASRGYLHPQYNFAESLVETARMLLCHSCRSELTRQGISLVWHSRVSTKDGLYLGWQRFIFEAISRIFARPSLVRCSPFSIIRRTSRNLRKSMFFFDLRGCFMKNGMI